MADLKLTEDDAGKLVAKGLWTPEQMDLAQKKGLLIPSPKPAPTEQERYNESLGNFGRFMAGGGNAPEPEPSTPEEFERYKQGLGTFGKWLIGQTPEQQDWLSGKQPDLALITDSTQISQSAPLPAGNGTPASRMPAANEPSFITAKDEQAATNSSVDKSNIALAAQAQTQKKDNPLAGYQSGFKDIKSAIKRESELASQRLENEAGISQDALGKYQDATKNDKIWEDQQQEKLENMQTDYKKSVENFVKLSTIDPNRAWANTGTGGKITAAISIALGAIGGAMTGKGGNVALDIINQAIDRDIDAQKVAASNAKAGIDLQWNMIAQTSRLITDERSRRALAKAGLLEAAKLQIDVLAKLSGSQEALERGKRLAGEITIQQEQLTAPVKAAMQNQIVLDQVANGRRLTPDQIAKLPEKHRELFVQGNGFSGFATTKEGAKSVQDKQVAVETATNELNDLISIGSKQGREFFPSEAKNKAKALSILLKGSLRTQLVGAGAVSEGEWKILDYVIANPTDLMQINALSQLKTIKEKLQTGLLIEAKARGVKTAEINFKEN